MVGQEEEILGRACVGVGEVPRAIVEWGWGGRGGVVEVAVRVGGVWGIERSGAEPEGLVGRGEDEVGSRNEEGDEGTVHAEAGEDDAVGEGRVEVGERVGLGGSEGVAGRRGHVSKSTT